jgi:hypothetical protein
MEKRMSLYIILLLFVISSCPLHAEEQNEAPPELASFVPADTLFYARIPSLKKTWESFQELPFYKLYKDDEVLMFLEALGQGLEKKVPGLESDLIQELLSLADLFDGETAFARITRKKKHDWIFSLTSSEEEGKVAAFVKDVLTTYLQGVFNERSIEKVAEFEICTYSQPGPPISVARTGRRILIAGRSERLADLLLSGQDGQGSLARNEKFLRARSRAAQEDPSFFLYLDLERVVKDRLKRMDAKEQAVAAASGIEGIRSLCASLCMQDGHAHEMVWLDIPGERGGLLDIFASKPVDPAAARIATRSAFLLLAGHLDFPKLYMTLISMAEASPNKGPFFYVPDAAKNIKAEVGLDLFEDVIQHLGTEVIFFADLWKGFVFFPLASLAIEVNNPEALEPNLFKIARSESGLEPRSTTYRGRKIYYQQLPQYSIPLWLSWCVTDGYLIVALMPMHIRNVINRLEGKAPSLRSNSRIEEQWIALTGDESVLVFVDSQRIFHDLYPILLLQRTVLKKDLPFDMAMLPQADTLASYLTFGLSGVSIEKDGILLRTRSDGYGPTSLTLYGLTGIACWKVLVDWGQ